MAGDGRKCAGFRVPKMIAGESFLRPKERIGRQPLVAEHEGLDGRRNGDPPSSEEIGDRRSFSAKGQAGMLSLNSDSCAPGVVAVCKVKQQRASGRQQETYLLCSVRREYSASSSGELRCPQRQSLQLKKTACEASIQKLVSSMGTSQSPHGTSSLPGGQAHKAFNEQMEEIKNGKNNTNRQSKSELQFGSAQGGPAAQIDHLQVLHAVQQMKRHIVEHLRRKKRRREPAKQIKYTRARTAANTAIEQQQARQNAIMSTDMQWIAVRGKCARLLTETQPTDMQRMAEEGKCTRLPIDTQHKTNAWSSAQSPADLCRLTSVQQQPPSQAEKNLEPILAGLKDQTRKSETENEGGRTSSSTPR